MAEDDPNQSAGIPQAAPPNDLIVIQPIDKELQTSYLDYAMSVIVGRALPDVKDGLKPVHRRILYAMNDLSLRHNQPHKKCARIVGEVLGKYHPHGDQSVYDALVRMGQDFSLRYMLVDGQGNFGSLDGDPPAAMRYTEARLARISDELLQDIDKETIEMTPNFDGSLEEPSVLPGKFPNLLVNGSTGIAVGMATNIPPHNIKEVCTAAIRLIDDPDTEALDIAEIMPGPDFPTGGIIQGRTGILQYYSGGRGKLRVRAVIEHETTPAGRTRLVITEIPYMVNKADLVQEIARYVKEKKIEGIADIVDESDRKGMRVVLELKKDASPEIAENLLYHHTRCMVTIGVIMIALVNGQPKVMGIKEVLTHYIAHRQSMVRKRTEYDLKKAEEKAHILEGVVVALDNIDEVIAMLKKARNADEGRAGLVNNYGLSERQANAILEMRLSRLTGLEQNKVRSDLEETRKRIEEFKAILSSEQRILRIIRDELQELIEKYGDARRTAIQDGGEEGLDLEDLIEPENMVVTISDGGYCKRLPVDTYRAQHRGGKGIIGSGTKEDDFIRHLFVANTHDWLMIFTDKGKVYWKKVYTLPESSRQSKGRPIINIINIDPDEKVRAVIPVREFTDDRYLVFVTRKGLIKKTVLSAYKNIRQTGIIAINLQDEDNLVDVLLTGGDDVLMIASRQGMAIKFAEEDVRPVGRNSMGVKGINLANDDQVVDALVVRTGHMILSVTENGYGKRSDPDDYRLINRGGKGVINIITSDRNGPVAAVKCVNEEQDIMVMSKSGITLRTPVEEIRVISRNTQGVRLMGLKEDDRVVACTIVSREEEGDVTQDAHPPEGLPSDPETHEEISQDPVSDEEVPDAAESQEDPQAPDEPEPQEADEAPASEEEDDFARRDTSDIKEILSQFKGARP